MVPPGVLTVALVLLSTAATVIASQALISGAFSMTHQAIQLGFLPRLRVKHTSKDVEGQVYVPAVNFVLAIACVFLALVFRESSRLAAASATGVRDGLDSCNALAPRTSSHASVWLPYLVSANAADVSNRRRKMLQVRRAPQTSCASYHPS